MDNTGISRGTVIRSFMWKLFERTAVQAMQFVVTIILARLLMPSEYGTIALIMVFINIFQVIVDGGFNTALIQKKDADNTDFSTILYFGLFSSAIMYLLLYFAAPLIARFYSQPELVRIIRVIGLVLIPNAINAVQISYVSRNMLFRKMFVCSLISVLVSGATGIIMAYYGWGVWALVAQTLLAQLVLIIVMWFVVRWRPQIRFSTSRLKGLLDYGWKIFVTNIIVAIFVNLRKLVIGRFYSPASLAYFERGDQFPNIVMSNINASIQAVMFPAFSKEQNNPERVKMMLRRATKMSCFVIYPLMMLLIVAAKPLVLFLLTEKWLPVAAFVQIFCVANFFRPITIPNAEAIKAMGYSGILLKLEIIKKIVDIIILTISVFLGVYAIAWGIVLFNFLCVFINLYPNKRILGYGVSEQMKDALPTLLITLLVGSLVFGIQYVSCPLFVILLLQGTIGCVLYLGCCYLFKEESFMYLIELAKQKGFFKKIVL